MTEQDSLIWMAIGFGPQSLFFMRFFVQWIYSERIGRSVVPVAFWYFRVGGGLGLLAYSIHRLDPVFILGQSCGLLIYGRNLYLIHVKQRRSARPPTPQER